MYENIFNFTDHEKFIAAEVKALSKVAWFKNQTGSFGKISSVPFAEIVTKRSMAFTFNILDFEDLMNAEE